MAGGAGAYRDDHANLVINEALAEHLADRMATRFHAIAQNLKGGVLAGAQGVPGPNPAVANQWGGKGIIKFNPSNNEVVAGIKQQISLFTWQSPDGLPHYVTIEVGRLAGGLGGPGSDGTRGGLTVVTPTNAIGQGSVGGGSWPAGQDVATNPLYYRAVAQVLIGTPGTMQDPFFVDINRGQRFTAVASYVAVTAQMNGPPIDEQTGLVVVPFNNTLPYISGSLAVYATLGPAVAPSISPVLYTQYIDNSFQAIAPAIEVSFTRIVPPRANILFPILQSLNGDRFSVGFYDNTGNRVGSTIPAGVITPGAFDATPMASPDGPFITPIVIPADAYGVILRSSGGNATNYRLIYQLSV